MGFKFSTFFLILILGLSFASAIEFTIKEEVMRGENLVVKVSGNFVTSLTKDNIYFYRRHLPTSIEPYGIMKIEGDYYIYAQVPFEKEVDNYSIWLKNIEYNEGIGIKTDDVFANFTVLENFASFSITPGILETTTNYFITLKNLKGSTIIVNYGEGEKTFVEIQEQPEKTKTFLETLFGKNEENETASPEETEIITFDKSIELKPGETKNMEFPIEEFVGFKKIKFNYGSENYEILIFMNGSKIVETFEERGEDEENVSEENQSNEENSEKEEETSNLNEEEQNELNNISEAAYANCALLNGTVCTNNQKCENGETEYTDTGICCLSQCVEVVKSNTGKTIGWVLIITIVLFLTWFFKNKYRRASPPEVDLEKESKGKR